MFFEDINSDNRFIVLWIGRINFSVIQMFLICECIKSWKSSHDRIWFHTSRKTSVNWIIPTKTNSKNVLRFSGDGEVTKMFEYPKATAPATAKPRAADFPLPLDAVRETVERKVFSEMASTNFNTAFAYRKMGNIEIIQSQGYAALSVKKKRYNNIPDPEFYSNWATR